MTSKSAERQRKYREIRKTGKVSQRRLDLYLDDAALTALYRLCRDSGQSKRVVLENLIRQADDQIASGLNPESEEWEKYFG